MHALSQAAALLGLPLFEQGADGALHANDAARALVGKSMPTDLIAALARAAGCAEDDARLLRVLASARVGRAASAVLDGVRIAAESNRAGGLCVVLLMSSLDLERRAALVDAAAEVTHELSNALSAIGGWAEIAREDSARIEEALDRIEVSARGAREAARGLLEAARGTRDAARRDQHALDAAALAVEVAHTLGPLAAARGARIEAVVEGPASVDDPGGKLWTVVWNLAKNAIEAAKDGGSVELRVTTQLRTVRLTISDDGPGMDIASRGNAFAPYFTTKPGGTGLGLPLVRDAVQYLGGTILLAGRRGGGLRAIVTLPLAPREPATRTRARSGPRDSGVRNRAVLVGRDVLIVEDDTALRDLVATTLSLRGARVTAVASGAAASALVGPFEVAIIDLTLGDVRGDRVLADLRARGVLRGPAIVATGGALPGALDAAPDAVLRKPFAIDEMTDLVAYLAEEFRASGARRA